MNTFSVVDLVRAMPKVDLHCHIDGSFSSGFVRDTLGIGEAEDVLVERLRAPEDCASLTEYLTCFDLPIKCMQTPTDIENGVLDVLKEAAEEKVKYIELRFAPAFSVNSVQDYRDVYEAAIAGCKKGLAQYNIYSNLILCTMRHNDLATNLKVLRSGMDYLGYGVCAIDLAGDESSFGNSMFGEIFTEANRLGMPFTIHSGECGSIENVKLAIEAGAKRIGHGIALYKDTQLMEVCKKSRIGLELCPTSNYQTKAIKQGESYPLKTFLDYGLLATVNTDNRTVSNTSIAREFELIVDRFDIGEEDLITLYKNSVEISFADDNIKNYLISLLK